MLSEVKNEPLRRDEATVVIVGGGPVGLSCALLLQRLGIDAVLLERRDFTTHFPRAHLLNVRTMEAFHDMGVSDTIYAMSPPENRWHRAAWYTSIGEPPAGGRREIGHVHAWGGGPDAERYAEASPRRFANLPQIRLDRVLWEHADAAAPGQLRAGQEVVGLDVESSGVTVSVRDRDSDQLYELRARYVIAADGGRSCSDLLGVEMEGPRSILDMVGLYVEADLTQYADPEALLTYIVNPHGQGSFAGGALALGPGLWANESPEWHIGLATRAGDATPQDEETLMARMRHELGLEEIDVKVKAITHWQFEGVIAKRFRVGPVFLLGDAAHRHPPTGGLGLNTGVQDAYNLCWKLDAVINGYASDALLDTYESERRPIAAANVEHSLQNAGRHEAVAAAIGLKPGQSEADGWREIEIWASDTPEGAQRRAASDDAVAANAEDFSQLNMEAGFAYERGAVIPDGTPPPPDHDSAIVFVPTARPGHHVPHVWSLRDGEAVSTVDLIARNGFTLLVSPSGKENWARAADSARTNLGCPVSVVAIENDARTRDGATTWQTLGGTGDDGALLVRPDKHVAWRTASAPADPASELDRVLRILLHGGAREAPTNELSLDGILSAGAALRGGPAASTGT